MNTFFGELNYAPTALDYHYESLIILILRDMGKHFFRLLMINVGKADVTFKSLNFE